ncbi:hypothetical protein NHH03_23570 [Stieleria sp. TO1_6]|uniref:hypothetical protein n=1 Tax=Stieleria tagensis TaxID=2956795 RepID=UPI00209B7094|nr:hypothetical protein [Stieleria tagensis]MCO8124737.1 hypothetical protein [Stieleria tagensis]
MKKQAHAQSKIDQLSCLKEKWLAAQVSDDQMLSALAGCDYKEMIDSGLSAQFDAVSEIGCAIELVQEHWKGEDAPAEIRKFAWRIWKSHISTNMGEGPGLHS